MANSSLSDLNVSLLPGDPIDIPELVAPNFIPRIFKEIDVVPVMHDTPRFGNTNDVAYLVHGTDDEKNSYWVGLMALSILMWCVLGVWAFALIYTRRNKKFGWLAGLPPKKPTVESYTTRSVRKGETIGAEEGVDEWDCGAEKENDDQKATRQTSAATASTVTAVSDKRYSSALISLYESQRRTSTEEEWTDEPAGVEVEMKSGTEEGTEQQQPMLEQVEAPTEGDPAVSTACPVTPLSDQSKSAKEEFTTPTDEPGPVDVETEKDEALVQWEIEVKKAQRKMRRCRWTVLICGVSFIVTSGFLIEHGFTALDDTISSALLNIPPLTDAVQAANNATSEYLIASNETRDARVAFINQFDFCPELWEQLNISLNGTLVQDIQDGINQALNYTHDVKYYYVSGIDEILYNVSSLLSDLEGTLDTVNDLAFYALVGITILLDVIVFMFMVGVILAWFQKQPRLFRDVSSRVVLPIFVFCVILLWIITPYMLLFSNLLGDFCVTSPDEQVVRMIDAPEEFDSLVNFYVRGCKEEDRPDTLFALFRILWESLAFLNQAIVEFVTKPGTLESTPCRDMNDFYGALTLLHLNLQALLDALEQIFVTMQCTNFNPIYTGLAYETACEYGMRATARMFFFLFIMTICSMIIITLRVAWYELDEAVEQDEDEFFDETLYDDSDDDNSLDGEEAEKPQSEGRISRFLAFLPRFFSRK